MPKRRRTTEKTFDVWSLVAEITGGGDRLTCNMEGGERTDACPWWGGGRGGVAPLEIGKKDAVRGNFSLFHLCFTKLGGEDRHTLHVCKMEGGGRTGACPWWEGVGARGLAPTLENGKKRLSKEILISFNYILLMKLGGGGDRHTCKMEGGGWTGACPW